MSQLIPLPPPRRLVLCLFLTDLFILDAFHARLALSTYSILHFPRPIKMSFFFTCFSSKPLFPLSFTLTRSCFPPLFLSLSLSPSHSPSSLQLSFSVSLSLFLPPSFSLSLCQHAWWMSPTPDRTGNITAC